MFNSCDLLLVAHILPKCPICFYYTFCQTLDNVLSCGFFHNTGNLLHNTSTFLIILSLIVLMIRFVMLCVLHNLTVMIKFSQLTCCLLTGSAHINGSVQGQIPFPQQTRSHTGITDTNHYVRSLINSSLSVPYSHVLASSLSSFTNSSILFSER